jgi:Holliday junction resolvase
MEKCTTRAQYGPMLGIKIRCGQHKLPGDVIETQTCEVSKCCNYPLYAPEGEYVPRRCKQHAKNTVYINVSEIECLSCKQKDFVNKNSKMCPNCHQYDKRVRKEIQIKDLFDKAGIEYDTHDKIYNGSCLRYRPDFVFKYNDRFIIVEVDEDQHKRYPCECDQIRMINLCQDFGGAPVVFIRFNPDKYKSFDGKLKKSKIDKRFPDLLKYIDIIKHMPVSSILTVAYLFYDGYDPDHRDIITINNFKSTVIERLKF